MDVRIVEDQAPKRTDYAVIFPALDLEGELEVWITPTRWEDPWLEAPEPATDEDRLDFALGMIEVAAASGDASVAATVVVFASWADPSERATDNA